MLRRSLMTKLGNCVLKVREFAIVFSVRPPQAGQSGRQKQQNFTNFQYANLNIQQAGPGICCLTKFIFFFCRPCIIFTFFENNKPPRLMAKPSLPNFSGIRTAFGTLGRQISIYLGPSVVWTLSLPRSPNESQFPMTDMNLLSSSYPSSRGWNRRRRRHQMTEIAKFQGESTKCE